MAKLYRRQDGGYYTRTYMGVLVTRQLHPDAVRYLNRRGVEVGDEIPTRHMEKLRNTRGWLFTKDEMPFGGQQFELPSNTAGGKQGHPAASKKRRRLTPEEEYAKATKDLEKALDEFERIYADSSIDDINPAVLSIYRQHRPYPFRTTQNHVTPNLVSAHKGESISAIANGQDHLIASSEQDGSRILDPVVRWYQHGAPAPIWMLVVVMIMIFSIGLVLANTF